MRIMHDGGYLDTIIIWQTLFGECVAKALFLKYIDHVFDPDESEWLYKVEFTNEFGQTTTKNVKVRRTPAAIVPRLLRDFCDLQATFKPPLRRDEPPPWASLMAPTPRSS